MRQTKFTVLLFILTMYILNINAEGAKNMLQNKPFLTVHLNTSSCTHEVRVNDVPLMPKSGRSVGVDMVTLPVNHWVQSGENELSVKIFPMPNEDNITQASVEVKLSVKPFEDNNPDKNFTIATLNYQGSASDEEELKIVKSSISGTFDSKNKLKKDENGDIIVGDITISKIKEDEIEGIKISRKITLPLPFPKWNWLSSDLIEDNEDTKKDLFNVYLKIYGYIKNKNFDLLYKMYDEYRNEHSIAMYDPSLKTGQNAIKVDANNPELELIEWESGDDQYVKLVVFGDSKLAKLVIAHSFGAMITFNEKRDGGGSMRHNFVFRKDGDKWIFCR